MATAEFNPRNLNTYIKKIKQIVNEIKKLDNYSKNFINTFQIIEQILLNQIQLLLQIRALLLAEFTIKKVISLIHSHQITSPELRPSAAYSATDGADKK